METYPSGIVLYVTTSQPTVTCWIGNLHAIHCVHCTLCTLCTLCIVYIVYIVYIVHFPCIDLVKYTCFLSDAEQHSPPGAYEEWHTL